MREDRQVEGAVLPQLSKKKKSVPSAKGKPRGNPEEVMNPSADQQEEGIIGDGTEPRVGDRPADKMQSNEPSGAEV